ncbi:MAG TPA: MarC family protein [Thermoanaerobaculia bacterium]|nr:MarC family protein [Thermoanaerobaculia bacterium]
MPSSGFAGTLHDFAETAFLAIAALIPIVNPLGGAPIFLAKTTDLSSQERSTIARLVATYGFLLLAGATLIGSHVLDFFDVSIPVVQVAGGLVVCSIGWALLNQPNSPIAKSGDAAVAREDPHERAFYPLTMPLTVGPGSISVAITLAANAGEGKRRLLLTILAHLTGMLIVSLSVYLCYRYAERILKRLGPTGTIVVVRLSAFILLCIGVQICWNGLHALVGPLIGKPAR